MTQPTEANQIFLNNDIESESETIGLTQTRNYITGDAIEPSANIKETQQSLSAISLCENSEETMDRTEKIIHWKNLASFWIFGLCNNFAYVVMLSAAHDILGDHDTKDSNHTSGNSSVSTSTTAPSTEMPNTDYLQCNAIGTGAILLADILPTLIIKLTFPFFIQYIPYSVKVTLVGLLSASSFIIVSFAHQLWLSILGVVCASFGAGLGEITFLSLTTFFHKNVVSSWSSGTGGAGVLGALAYAGFTSAGLSPRISLLIMISIPVFMLVTYKFLLGERHSNHTDEDRDEADDTLALLDERTRKKNNVLTLREKLSLIPSLFKYMIPLSIVYFAEYFINQGLHELLYYNGQFLSKKEQYRWFQVDYQIGVFISRSSVNFFQIRKLWILPILQIANMILLTFQVFYRFIPSLWIILAIIFWEGLLGGAGYVNTFYLMSCELASETKEYCIGLASVADSFGIAIAGAIAVPTHKRICSLKIKM